VSNYQYGIRIKAGDKEGQEALKYIEANRGHLSKTAVGREALIMWVERDKRRKGKK